MATPGVCPGSSASQGLVIIFLLWLVLQAGQTCDCHLGAQGRGASENTGEPSELAFLPASPQLSRHLGAYGGRICTLKSPLASPQSHSIQKCQSNGMAVTISVDKGWGWHPGMGTKISEKVMMSGSWVFASSGPSLFSFIGGALCCAGSGVGTRAFLQRQHAFTAHQSLGRNTLNPHRSSSPFPESSRKHSINLMQAKTERGVGGDGGDGSVHGGGRPG